MIGLSHGRKFARSGCGSRRGNSVSVVLVRAACSGSVGMVDSGRSFRVREVCRPSDGTVTDVRRLEFCRREPWT